MAGPQGRSGDQSAATSSTGPFPRASRPCAGRRGSPTSRTGAGRAAARDRGMSEHCRRQLDRTFMQKAAITIQVRQPCRGARIRRSALSSGRPTRRGRASNGGDQQTVGTRSRHGADPRSNPSSTPPKARSSGSALGQSSSTAGRTTTSIPRGVPTTPRRRPSLSPPRTRPLFRVLRLAHP